MTDPASPKISRNPERAGFSDVPKRLHESTDILLHVRDVVGLHALTEEVAREHFEQVVHGDDARLGFGFELFPVSEMFFRPEEVHGASGEARVLHPLEERHRYVPNDAVGLFLCNLAVLYFHVDGLAAIEAGRVDIDGFTGEEPADRQRFERSLAEPLLLTFDGDAVLVLKIVKRGH